MRQGAEWETNVFRRPSTDRFDDGDFDDGRKHGYSWVTNGGLLADTMLMGGRMRLAFSVDGQWEVRSRDEQADTRETNAQAGVSYRWPSGITASGGIIYERLEDPIEVQEDRRRLRQALSRLPEDDQQLLEMQFIDQASPQDLRSRFGVRSRNAIWKRLQAAKERLRKAFRQP